MSDDKPQGLFFEDENADHSTLLSFLLVFTLLQGAYVLSTHALPKHISRTSRLLFIWHAFDFLVHTVFEGSFIYNCFYSSAPFDPAVHHPSLITNFLKQPDKVFGAKYGEGWANKLWMVYSKADTRWEGADLTIVSLELLTVFVAGPLAAYICYAISRRQTDVPFWSIVLATGEIYGGFMTFCPEWLTGSQNLVTNDPMFLWVYLIFFNGLWVVIPGWVMYVSYKDIQHAFSVRNKEALNRLQALRKKQLLEKRE